MKTRILKFASQIDEEELIYAANLIRKGELVAFPTETVYGLGANAFNEQAVANIFKVKGRPQDNPLIAHLSNLQELEKIAIDIPDTAYSILQVFAPGPLTVILKKSKLIPDIVSAGLNTVGIRFPSNMIARRLIETSEVPIVAPSANLSGKPSPTKAWHVYEDLEGKIPCIIDGGPCQYGLESTILDFSNPMPEILRPGFISAEDIFRKTGIEVINYHKSNIKIEKPKAPGQKYKHYSPKAKVIILDENGNIEKRLHHLQDGLIKILKEEIFKEKDKKDSIKLAFFISSDIAQKINSEKILTDLEENIKEINIDYKIITYNNTDDATDAANHLFDCFREFDQQNFDYILCTAEPLIEKGLAYMNRLEKAASFRI